MPRREPNHRSIIWGAMKYNIIADGIDDIHSPDDVCRVVLNDRRLMGRFLSRPSPFQPDPGTACPGYFPPATALRPPGRCR